MLDNGMILPQLVQMSFLVTCRSPFSLLLVLVSRVLGLNIQFLVSYSGERSNPQNKIVTALAEIITSDWTFRIPANDNTSTQSFQLAVVTSYIFTNEDNLKSYEPPAPPALFKVPYDVFYPFVVNSASSKMSFSSSSPFSLLLSCVTFFFLSYYFFE
jgi:hypothetical protein